MYKRPWMVIAVPAGLSLIGFIFDTYDVVSMFWIFQYFAIGTFPYLAIANLMYTAYLTQMPTKIGQILEPMYNHHTGAIVEQTPSVSDPGFIPMKRKPVATVPVMNQQVVSAPRFDKERNFAITLWRQHDQGFTVNLTEAKWVKSGKFSHDEFAVMMDNWEGYGISGREGKKRKRVILDWRKVRMVAEGNSLPPPLR